NPTSTVAGNQHWGHATSTDLYHWENQPIAIYPPNNISYIYTGSAVIDSNNTSGFFPNQDNGVVAIYTIAVYTDAGPGPQTQNIAYSRDGGYTFTPYANNPVIDRNSSQFRDPHVTWYEDHWVMVVAFAAEFSIGIYTSENLVDWTFASNFSHHGLLGLQYECPNMVEMPVNGTDETMFLMFISINPGAPLGGSISQYFPGTFNGTHFTATDEVARIADFGKDNYAAQYFFGTPRGEPPVMIAWVSNWEYSQAVPTGPLEGWRSAMSVPRRNYLANITRQGLTMISEPYDLSPVIGNQLASNSSLGNGSVAVDYSSVASNALYFQANVSGLPRTGIGGAATMNVTFFSPLSGESLQCGYYFGGDNPVWLNRGNVRGFDNIFFTDKFSDAKPIEPSGEFSLSGIIDRSVFELFVDGGRKSATATFFPEQPLTLMSLATANMPPNVTVLRSEMKFVFGE
ncbi:hypothetical protein LTS18_003399, partial [Coniosporium uncinatum]